MENIFGEIKKPNSAEYVVGLDLTDKYSQLSFGLVDSEEVQSFANVPGSTDYLIPTKLYKRLEVNQWFAGTEAVKQPLNAGFLVEDMLKKAMNDEEIEVGDEKYRPAQLIGLFIKRVLSHVNPVVPTNRIASFMVTVENLSPKMVSVMSEAVSLVGLKNANIYFQSHMESFYFYTIYSPRELWQHDVMLFDFSKDYLTSYNMVCNKNTTPIVVFIDNKVHSVDVSKIPTIEPESFNATTVDRAFSDVIERLTNTRVYSSFYLIGENFRQEVIPESVKTLCRKGHVFGGNNLYSKGAAYSARNKLSTTILSNNHVFLGNDKLKSNVGMNVYKRGEKAYMPLVDAGVNWFEVAKETDIILNQTNKLSFVITPLTGKNPEIVDITLDELPKRPPKTTRLHISIKMIEETKMQVKIKDLGFGDLYPAAGIEWNEVISV